MNLSHRSFFLRSVLGCASMTLLTTVTAHGQSILAKPYVQPGNGATLQKQDQKVIMWLTDQVPGDFVVEYGPAGGPMVQAKVSRVALDFKPSERDAKNQVPANLANEPKADAPIHAPVAQHYFRYCAALDALPMDSEIQYQVKLRGAVVRKASFHTRASSDKPIHFIMVGDLGDDRAGENEVAYQMGREKPDFMVILGDLVHPAGRVIQYMSNYWAPYCNTEDPGPKTGAPLMATIPFYPALGNHDVAARPSEYPDALGAYYFFSVPENGPGEGPWSSPLGNDKEAAAAFRTMAGKTYPALGFYSFDDGPAHILILDSNGYVPVGAAPLVQWIENDLKQSKAPWKFVCFHSPAFHTSREHYTEQKMRLLEPLFEKYGVDVVFAGHVHNYQRSKPLHFTPKDPTRREPRGTVSGTFVLDDKFDGITNTHPKGVIHIVSGGGGAHLYATNQHVVEELKKDYGSDWAPFTAKIFSNAHSFTEIDLTPQRFHLRAITDKGEVMDQITIEKPAAGESK